MFSDFIKQAAATQRGMLFQSLGRDSVFSDFAIFTWMIIGGPVSIPRSGFCVFGLDVEEQPDVRYARFNPSVGILCFRTDRAIPGWG